VIASDHGDRGGGLGFDSLEKPVELPHRTLRRRRPVEDIAGDDQRIDAIRLHRLDDLVEHRCVILLQGDPVELTTEMQVGGVQQLHDLFRIFFIRILF